MERQSARMRLTDGARERAHRDAETARERLSLIALCAVMVLAGVVLKIFGGGPRPPAGLLSPPEFMRILAGSSLPLEPLVALLVDLAWVLWLWIVVSLLLELLLAGARMAASGAEWVAALRRVADRLSFPLARRVVTAAFAVQVLSRGASIAAAQPLSTDQVELVADASTHPPVPVAEMLRDVLDRTYIVRDGDTLWSIAEREYGAGAAYRSLVQANSGRRMPDGRVFTAHGVIRPGWDLVVPPVSALVDETDGERWYTVRQGDTLSGIAAVVLGDETAWHDVFELNRGAHSPDGRHELRDPNVIWPGLRLRLPDPLPSGPAEVAEEPPVDELPVVELSAATAPPPPEGLDVTLAPPPPFDALDPADPPPPDAGSDAGSDTEEPSANPLLRTPHALYPVTLEPADAGVPDAEPSSAAGDLPALANASSSDFPTGPVALGGAGLIGAVGIALGARRLRRLPREPESEVVVEGGFAEAQLTAEVTRAGGSIGDPLNAIVARVQHLIDEYNLSSVDIVSARHGRSSTSLTLAANLAEQTLLIDLAPVFTERLDADVETWISPDQDVGLCVSRHGPRRLLTLADGASRPPCLIPLGVLYDRQVLYVACQRLGHMLIASLPGHGADTILTSLIATMTARRSPEQLQVWAVAQARDLPAPVLQLPHVARVVDPTDSEALQQFLDRLRAELDDRARRRPSTDLVVAISELTSLGEHALMFELLAGRASAAQLGVSVIAATTDPDNALQSPLQPHFTTRMVLRMQDEETSVGLLGVADAAFLGGGGRLLVRVEEREAVELYGYQVTNEHLERLVRVMRSAYAAPTRTEPETETGASLEHDAAAPEDSVPAETDAVADVVDQEPRLEPAPDAASIDTESADPPIQETTQAVESADPAVETRIEVRPTVAAPIEVVCFDGPRITCRDQPVWPRQNTTRGGDVKPWEFLLYLACQPAEGVSAEAAVEALWPGGGEINMAHRFRQLRYRLRQAFATLEHPPETDGISFDRGTLRLDPAIVRSDAQEFLELVREARVHPGPRLVAQLERARALYAGDLLAGPDAHRYAWLDERDNSGVTLREHFRRLYQQASTSLAQAYVGAGQLEPALELYQELTEIDPGDERHWTALYRLHAQRGDRLGLLREERRMRAILRELAAEVGQAGDARADEPSREMKQEFERLLAGLRDSEPETAAV